MEGEQRGTVSEWNQQVAFDYVFHTLSFECRRLQENQDVIGWSKKIETLFMHCEAIFEEQGESDKIQQKMDVVRREIGELQRLKMMNAQAITVAQQSGKCYLHLFELERIMRRAVNAHSPFLNLAKDIDIKSF